MKSTKIYLIVLAILASALVVVVTPGTVSADRTYHFTFRVPVELNNIPTELRSWRIWIYILGPADMKIGEKYTPITVNKSYNRTKVIRFDAVSGKNPRDAIEARIQLQVRHGGRWQNACAVIGTRSTPYERDTTKPVRCHEDKIIAR